MLTLHDRILKQAGGLFAALCAALAFCAGSATNLHAQIPPANDDLTNAQVIVGYTGTVNGDSLNATAETNEPAPVKGNPAQASIWYLWTAPYTTTIDFNTRGSTDPNTGDELDTVLAVYSLTAGTNVSMTNLTQLASNDDDPSGGVVSRVDVPVTVGTTYYIQVDGSTNTPTGSNAQGNIVVNWSPSLVGGSFGFSASTYFAGEFDDEMFVDWPGNPVDPSLQNAPNPNEIRITVTRQNGYTGNCQVTLLVTNLFYMNQLFTNITGTNIYTTNYNTNGFAPADVINFTNTYFTNLAFENIVQDFINNEGAAQVVQIPIFGVNTVYQTNADGTVTPPVTNSATLANLGLTNFFTNFFCFNQRITNIVTNSATVTVSITQLFCTNIITNSISVSASNGVDYVAYSNVLTFNDFQMSQDVFLEVNPGLTFLAGPDWPDSSGNYLYYGVNPLVSLVLTNAVLGSNEDLDITPPTLSSSGSTALLDILSFDGNPNNYLGSPSFLTTNSARQDYVTINLERATFRVNKSSPTAYLYLYLNGTPAQGDTYALHYTIDCAGVDESGFSGIPFNAFDYNGFSTVADSDYAVPSYNGVPDPDFGVPINQPPDPSGIGVGQNSLWPSGAPYLGSITIGPFYGPPPYGEIAIPILTNGAVEFDVDMEVEIFITPTDAQTMANDKVPGIIGNIRSAILTINSAGIEPGGANDVSFNVDGVAGSYPPNNPIPGANGGTVNAVAIQANGQAVIGGYFSSYNTTPIYGVARLLTNGFLDTSFNSVVQYPGINYGGFVKAIAIDPVGRIIIGGNFTSYDGTNAVNIARLNYNGTLDTTFNSGIGFNNIVNALAIDANGNILVAGNFTSYNTTNVNHIARLLPSGGLDPSFLPNTANGNISIGTDQEVLTVAPDGNGNVILGGQFSYVNGSNLVYLARLLQSGAVDPTFNPEIGPDGPIESVAIEPDNEIVIGGAFQNFNLVSRSGIALIGTTGALDTTFAPGTGLGGEGIVYSVALQPNGDVLLGGQFRSVNGSRRLSVARLLPQGWVDTSFMDTSYNQFAGLINVNYNDPVNIAYALGLQPDGNIIVGGSFTRVGGGNSRTDIHSKINVARLIGLSTPGPQTGGGGIGNCPGNIELTQNPYTVDDTAGKLFVTLNRLNGSLGPAQLTLGTNTAPTGPGNASSADFSLVLPAMPLYNELYNHGSPSPYGSYGWRKSDGYYGFNNAIQPTTDQGDSSLNIFVFNDLAAAGVNLTADLSLLNVTELGIPNAVDQLVLGGVLIPLYPALGTPSATLEIINDNISPGVVGFSSTNFTAVDTSNSVTLTVLRTNGYTDGITVYYYTANGTAISGENYTGITPPTLSANYVSFTGGANNSSATFTIPITKQSTVQNSKYFKVYLASPTPGGIFDTNVPPILPTNTVVTIIDGNFAPGHLSFSSPTFSALKGGLATVSVERTGGALGELTVQCGTSNGTATNGLNYTGVTNTLSWSNQDVSVKTMTIQTLQDNTVDGPKTVNLSLFNATNVSGGVSNSYILTTPSNAVLNILESDSYGFLSFAAPNFNILQTANQALITVVRTRGTTGTISVNYATFNDTNVLSPYQAALAGTNYGATNGVLTFGPGVASQSFVVPIYYTPAESNAANRVVTLELFDANPAAITNQFPVFATLTILDPQLILNPAGSIDLTTLNGTGFNSFVNDLALQPDGSTLAAGDFTFFNQYPFNYVARLNPYGDFDSSFLFDQAGANGDVTQILSQTPTASQTNGPIVIAGNFTMVDGANRTGIARLNLNGSIDQTFNPGSGADGIIYSVAETVLPASITGQPPTFAFYIAGGFANYDGVPMGGIARLNGSTNSPGYQGNSDPNFNIGQGVTGSSAIVRAVAVQANNQVVLGGDFTAFNGVTHNHLVRLNLDGSVDTTFNPSTGSDPTDTVRAIAIQPNGQILIGGSFTNVNGSNYNYLARLNSDGSVDTNFNVGVGGDNTVLALTIDSQQRILVGGQFARFSGVTRSGLTRLNPDGTVDPTINFQSGADGGFVDSIVVETNDEIEVAGGFSSFEGTAENNFVRLYGGANTGDGAIQFSQPVYGVLENGTNATITLQRLGGEGTTTQPTVTIVFSTSDGTAVAGTDYMAITTNVTFPLGETYETVTIPILNNVLVGSNKFVNLNLSSPTYASIGVQASAILIITNVNSAVSFSASSYNESADAPGGSAIIPIVRIGDPNTTVGISVYTGTNGSATPYTNYVPESNFIVFNPGVMTNYFLVPVLSATNMFSPQTVDLEMTGASNVYLGSPDSALLTINNVLNGPGLISFAQTNYFVSEGAGFAAINITRTNGDESVSVTLTTSNGTAISGLNYVSIQTNVSFTSGETNQTIDIPVIQQALAGPDTTVYLTLSNPQGGATISGATQEILTIQNDIENFNFANTPYFVSEGAGSVTLDIVRTGPITNAASVGYTTYSPPNATEANGYAVTNVDYVPQSGTLNFVSNETFTTISIPILQGNVVNGPLTFQVLLDNPSPAGVQIGTPGTASVTILSDVTGFQFSTNAYAVAENGSNLVVTVNRLNAATGTATVQFATSDGTAVHQVDYVATNGTLVFSNGVVSNSFIVPILNPNIVENNKSFTVTLSDPLVTQADTTSTNAFLVSPSNATVTITNVLTGVSFGNPTYSVSECGVQAVIPVILTGATNNLVSVNCGTTNGGSAGPGTNYFPGTNAFTFEPGQTSTNFYVDVINNHIIGPNHTVLLNLWDAAGAQLLSPSTAILTIEECNGAFIVESGTAFVSGNLAPSGVIFPNETVTLLFGLRDVAGFDTTNLVATLLATNGVTNVSGPQTYGVLVTNGPTVARAFTFTTVGTNGQNISATLSLKDGTEVYSNVVFGFTLGGAATVFSNSAPLIIPSTSPVPPGSKAYNTNLPDDGYPSMINVSGVAGAATAVTATLNGFGDTYPQFVTVVLEGPDGQNTYLMADCGGGVSVGPVNLTFSQSASNSLPESSAITNGTYLPTAYSDYSIPLTNGAPAGPYPTTLSSFDGISPNGIWSLFVAYEDTADNGYISNGWSLSISTGIPIEEDSDLELSITAVPTILTVGNTVVYSVSVTNYGPAEATNVVITDTLPPGVTYGTNLVGTNGLVLTNTVATLAVSNGVTFNISVVPTALGYLTNIAAAVANQPDPNSNNVQTNVLLVGQPNADLAVTLSESPNPVVDGTELTYTIVVTNNGPSAATGVTAVNVLPAGFFPITITPGQGVASNVNGTITWNVGALGSPSSSSATMTILAGAAVPESGLPSSANLDSVSVSSAVYDPTKANNYAAVKTEVEPSMITVTPSGTTYMLSWPATPTNFVLQGAVTLTGTWVSITNSSVVAQEIGGVSYDTYTLPGTNGYHFFRLKSQLP